MEITPAERITHQIAAEAKKGAFWFGVVASLFAFAALRWNVWSFREKKKDDDEKWREHRLWETRKRDGDKREAKIRRNEEKEEKRKDRGEADKKQSAIDKLDKQVSDLINRVTKLENDKLEQREKRELLESVHREQLARKQEEIERLQEQKAIMKRLLDLEPLPGWLPGSSGER